mgnify:CR=1 FL=1
MLLTGALPVHATALQVSLDTSALAGTDAVLAFDFMDSDCANNAITISDFLTDGTLGTPDAPFDGVAGVLPATVTLSETGDSLIELLQGFTLGTRISFTLDLTEAASGVSPFDSFALFLLDDSLMPLFATNDLTGADALFAVDIDGTRTGQIHRFAPADPSAAVSWTLTSAAVVPAPSPLWLLTIGALGTLGARARPRRATPSTLPPSA